MIQRGYRARLLLETPQAVHVLGQGRGEDLDRDLAPEPRIFGAIYFAHAARADRRDNLVGP